MLGHAEGWFYGALAGIRVDHAAASANQILTIAPRPVASLSAAAATHRSVYGRIASRWQRDGTRITYDITLPPGPGGTIILPADAINAREGGVPLAQARGIRSVEATAEGIRVVAQSGRYRIET
ncbi:alpha-L-rhamnosidase C-terminal domain-containing protein [Sphingomonas jinjuensis]|nr:alpha-L-rhamnosidase C-terminal domain-containing protein [Sphingomonas jinjuensis]